MHPASPPHGPSADGHQQPQQQQQVVTRTTLQDSMAAAPAETHTVGEELDDRASTAAPLLQHTAPVIAADHSLVHTHKPVSSLTARDIVGEERDPKASTAASQPHTALKAVHEPEQPPRASQLPKSDEPAMAHADDHQSVVVVSQGGRPPDTQADKGQAGAMQDAQEECDTWLGDSSHGHERSHADSPHRHIREGAAAEALGVEDGEVPGAACDGSTEAVQKAADAVVGEELHPKAATPAAGRDTLRNFSGPAAISQHQALHGTALSQVVQVPFWLAIRGLDSRRPEVRGAQVRS